MKKVIYLCDYCGEECGDTEFILPEKNIEEVKDNYGIVFNRIDILRTKSKNICKKCQRKIACVISYIDFTDVISKQEL